MLYRTGMGTRFVGCSLLVTFSAIILILARLHQKPLCINSQYIEKITFSDDSLVYRCALSKPVPYSKQFRKFDKVLHSQIVPFELWLRSFVQVKNPRIQIQVNDYPSVTRSEGKKIYIWESNLDQEGDLQREIAKLILKQAFPELSTIDSLSEFYVRAWNNRLGSEYGDVKSYVSHQWWVRYKALRLKDKYVFLTHLPAWSESKMKVDLSTADFDHLLLTANLAPDVLARFDQLQKAFPKAKLGIWDGQSLYHMPSRSRLTAETFKVIKARHFIWESCNDLDLQSLIQIPAEVRKLMVVRNCDPQMTLDYRSYVSRDVEGFAARYPQVAFVRLDLPSLKSKKDFIRLQQKIFDLMTRRQVDDPFFLAFGWQEINLNQKLQIYIPRAYVDAVESFRVR